MKKVVEKIRQIDINSLIKFGMALGVLFTAWLTLNLKVEHTNGKLDTVIAVSEASERAQGDRILKVETALDKVAEAQHKLSESQLVTAKLLQQHMRSDHK